MSPELHADVVLGDPAPPAITGSGRHVSREPAALAIRAFVGGRFPRHRADVGDDDLDREYAELTVPDLDVVERG